MPHTEHLTARAAERAAPRAKPYELHDATLPGLLLRVQPSGRRSFVLVLARGRRRTIGNAATVTLAQARVTARRWLADRDAGKLPDAARGAARPLTLAEFVADKYGPWVLANRKAGAATLQALRATWGHLYPRRLRDLTAWQVERVKADRLHAGTAPATVNRDLTRLRGVLSKAVEWGALASHPMRSVKLAKVDAAGRTRYLSEEEEQRLRVALADRDATAAAARDRGNAWLRARHRAPRATLAGYSDSLTPAVLLSLNTGLRRGELTALVWADIDLPAATLRVRGETAKAGRTRHVPLNTEAVAVLGAWRDAQPAAAADPADAQPPAASARLFPVHDWRTSWAAVLAAAAIDGFRWHDLRHTFASKLVMAGVDLNTVRALLGHASLAMTLRYAHLAPSHTAAAVARLVQGAA